MPVTRLFPEHPIVCSLAPRSPASHMDGSRCPYRPRVCAWPVPPAPYRRHGLQAFIFIISVRFTGTKLTSLFKHSFI